MPTRPNELVYSTYAGSGRSSPGDHHWLAGPSAAATASRVPVAIAATAATFHLRILRLPPVMASPTLSWFRQFSCDQPLVGAVDPAIHRQAAFGEAEPGTDPVVHMDLR